MDEPTDLKFCREVKKQKIFDTCPEFFQNLDQGLENCFSLIWLEL